MSSDEAFLQLLAQALSEIGLDAIVVGSMAGALQGAPIMTQDIDLLIRDTPRNHEKLTALAQRLGAAQPFRVSDVSRVMTLLGAATPIDILFDEISGGLAFAALRARADTIQIADQALRVASLPDVITSKAAAGRPKDLAQLVALKAALAARG